jgi:hypothetical protein
MRRKTNQPDKSASKAWKRSAILLGAVLLFFSAQLLAKNNNTSTVSADVQQEVAAPKRVLVLSVPDRKLALMENGAVVEVYDVAVGKPSTPSPIGEMKIINKVVDPTYYHKGKVVKPGKSNPLGNRWMGLSDVGYGIHGTNVQSSIGKAASHGCFRMRRGDVEDLFKQVEVGDAVEIHGERDAQVAEIFGGTDVVAQSATQSSTEHTTVPAAEVVAAMADEL